jgi:hypothetical protein
MHTKWINEQKRIIADLLKQANTHEQRRLVSMLQKHINDDERFDSLLIQADTIFTHK